MLRFALASRLQLPFGRSRRSKVRPWLTVDAALRNDGVPAEETDRYPRTSSSRSSTHVVAKRMRRPSSRSMAFSNARFQKFRKPTAVRFLYVAQYEPRRLAIGNRFPRAGFAPPAHKDDDASRLDTAIKEENEFIDDRTRRIRKRATDSTSAGDETTSEDRRNVDDDPSFIEAASDGRRHHLQSSNGRRRR